MGREPEFLRQVLLPGGSVSEQSIAAARADALGELFAAGSLAQARPSWGPSWPIREREP